MKRGVGRHAQLTAFIMVGILLLIVTSLIIFLVYNVPNREVLPLVPAEIRPVYDTVDQCVKQLGEDAVRRLAAQGGYMNLPVDISHNPTSYLAMDPEASLKVPLWYYDGEDRTPPLNYMEHSLAEEIRTGLPDCLNNFESLRDKYAVEPKGPLEVNVTLARDNVVIRTHYPLSWMDAGKQVTYGDYLTLLDVHLRDMWEFANATMLRENSATLLENATIDLMAIDPEIPMDALIFDCTPKQWRLSEIQSRLQEDLRVNLPSVRFKNTNYATFDAPEATYERLRQYSMADINAGRIPGNVPADAYEYLRLFWDVGVAKPDLRAALSYQPRFGMALTGSPNDGGSIQSRVVRGTGGYLNFLCVNTYHVTYDVIYPVLFTVRDDTAFTGRGATFQMAFPVLIHTNEPNRVTFGLRSFRGFDVSAGFCDQLGESYVDLRAEGVEGNESMATELDDVQFSLRCVGRECSLGNSSADDGVYRLRTRLPAGCASPIVVASKEGYLASIGQLEGDTITLPLTPLRPVKVTVVKDPYYLDTKSFGASMALGAAENVSIHVKLADSTYEQFLQYPQNDTLQLLDGAASYDVTALLSQFGSLTGGFVQEGVTLDSLSGGLTLHVLEGRPVVFNEDYQSSLTTYLYGNDYQARLAPEAGP